MDVSQIPIITVSYNSPDLIDVLLTSLRLFYANRVYVIDGSAPDIVPEIAAVTNKFTNVELIPFHYNIHHGPGMAWAIRNLGLSGPALFLDSDVEVLHPGMLEDLAKQLEPHLYGVGWITHPALIGTDSPENRFPYLSPLCMLCNVDVMRQWPLPIKHGAPMITPMIALAESGQSALVHHVDWIENDCTHDSVKRFMRHDWQGTVRRTSGYHYDAPPTKEEVPDAHMLALIPDRARTIIEIGCGSGTLARAYKQKNPACEWTGLETDASAVHIARKPCDFVIHQDINIADERLFDHATPCDCWVISTPLEQITDPWALLRRIRTTLRPTGCVLLSCTNMQHWSVQARLSQGLLDHDDQTGPRRPRWWFTRATLLALLQQSGFHGEKGTVQTGNDPGLRFLPALQQLTQAAEGSVELAAQDAQAVRFWMRARPSS
ncbi:MAG: methyltransferase domain-containing protein [Rhodoferax sp.]